MNQEKINKIVIAALVVCLLVGFTAMFLTRTVSRETTAEELEAMRAYDVLWDSMPEAQEGQTAQDRILALCAAAEDTTLGENQYSAYTSETLGQYLYRCATVDQLLVSGEGVLYISYTDSDGINVILGYQPEGLWERSVYDPGLDILYHELDGTVTVYEHFSSSAS